LREDADLLRHQCAGVRWMKEQEDGPPTDTFGGEILIPDTVADFCMKSLRRGISCRREIERESPDTFPETSASV